MNFHQKSVDRSATHIKDRYFPAKVRLLCQCPICLAHISFTVLSFSVQFNLSCVAIVKQGNKYGKQFERFWRVFDPFCILEKYGNCAVLMMHLANFVSHT